MVRRREGVWLKSPAKVNLGLWVLGVRPDNYHEVETWMQQVTWFDRVWICPEGRSIRVTTSSRDVPSGRENLAYRAAAALRNAAGDRGLGARIHLEKNIPAGAGLGGGSGNAAVVLWALNRFWQLDFSPLALSRIAADIGSDVPFFLAGPAAFCQGRGELVTRRKPLQSGFFLLVKPPYSLPTAKVYGWMRKKLKNEERPSRIGWLSKRLKPTDYCNDLEEVVFKWYPQLRECRDTLIALGAGRALMSGSGPTLWGLFRRRSDAVVAATEFGLRHRWIVRMARPLTFSTLAPKSLKKSQFRKRDASAC